MALTRKATSVFRIRRMDIQSLVPLVYKGWRYGFTTLFILSNSHINAATKTKS
jgi:hypothetical protein